MTPTPSPDPSSFEAWKARKDGRVKHCSNCTERGHNKTSCPYPENTCQYCHEQEREIRDGKYWVCGPCWDLHNEPEEY